MVRSYYRRGAQRASQVRALFASIAPRYDLINDLQSFGWHRRWKRRLLAEAAVQPAERALDVCTGTGDVAFRLLQAGANTTGADFSLPMLQVAQQRSTTAPSPVNFLAADGLHLPFQDGSFDLLTVGYGLRNLPDFDAGLREFLRVTRIGGRLLVLDFGKPGHPLWRTVYFAYLRLALPVLGKLFCGDAAAYAYILESLQHYPDQRGVTRLLQSTGWSQVRVVDFLGGVMSLHCAVRPGRPTDHPSHRA